jgi:aspartyl-tRNA synthetase
MAACARAPYDLVPTHREGSGSIRILRSDMKAARFSSDRALDEEAKHRLGFLARAYKYGTPRHGGFALRRSTGSR